jgi:hypothetical protein
MVPLYQDKLVRILERDTEDQDQVQEVDIDLVVA